MERVHSLGQLTVPPPDQTLGGAVGTKEELRNHKPVAKTGAMAWGKGLVAV